MSLLIAGATGYGRWPANTLAGARLCLDAPVDGIEIDVQLTADGHVVAHHDYRVSPEHARLDGNWLTEPGAPIKTSTLADLRRYDVGRLNPASDAARRYPDAQAIDGEPIPTLAEILGVLADAPGPRRLLYVEIKTDPTDPVVSPEPQAILDAVVADLAAFDWIDRAKVIAFDWRVLRLCAAREARLATAHLTIPTALAVSVKPGPDGRSPWTDGADAILHGGSELAAIKAHGGMEWSPYHTDVTAERIDEARALGLKVGPWGVSRGADIRRLAEMGVFSTTVSGREWG